jgi:serine/threonine-protein kinase
LTLQSDEPLGPGASFGRYRILDRLGDGGMGVVYRAEDTDLGRPVALKFLSAHLAADQEWRARFVREARAASALEHPNICTIFETGETAAGRLYIAMACYDGETLERRIRRGPLAVDEVVDYASSGRRLPMASSSG